MEPSEARGLSYKKIIATGDTNVALLRPGAANFYGYDLFNVAAYSVYIHFYDTATIPTAGTTVPVYTVVLPTVSGRAVMFPYGVHFKKGLGISITKAAADNDGTAVVAGDVIGALFFK